VPDNALVVVGRRIPERPRLSGGCRRRERGRWRRGWRRRRRGPGRETASDPRSCSSSNASTSVNAGQGIRLLEAVVSMLAKMFWSSRCAVPVQVAVAVEVDNHVKVDVNTGSLQEEEPEW